jgi:hypothetical protein
LQPHSAPLKVKDFKLEFLHMNQPRNAITLVELAIMLLCIIILMALLIPAISEPNTPARRNLCSTQLRNLSLAAIQHENSRQHLASWVIDFGTFGAEGKLVDPSDDDADQRTLTKHRKIGTWAVALLPWLDAQPTYEHWTDDRYPVVGGGSGDNPLSTGVSGEGFSTFAATNFSLMQCPSDNKPLTSHGRNSYISNTGLAILPTLDPMKAISVVNAKGEQLSVTFVDSLKPQFGVFNNQLAARLTGDHDGTHLTPIGPKISLDDFKDGQGNTVLFTESLHALPWHRAGFTDREDLIYTDDPSEVFFPKHSRFTNGMVWHPVDWENGGQSQPIHRINGPVPGGTAVVVTAANAADLARPSSNHADGVNVGMADGGTRYITDSIDMKVWNALLTPQGRERISEDAF